MDDGLRLLDQKEVCHEGEVSTGRVLTACQREGDSVQGVQGGRRTGVFVNPTSFNRITK